jgi:hypothetical protein
MCGSCHDINRLKAGYAQGWRTVMRMMQNMEVPTPADQVGAVTEYLTKSFLNGRVPQPRSSTVRRKPRSNCFRF